MIFALDDKLTFGKYQGLTVREIRQKDKGYLDWINRETKHEIVYRDSVIPKEEVKPILQAQSNPFTDQYGRSIMFMAKYCTIDLKHRCDPTGDDFYVRDDGEGDILKRKIMFKTWLSTK